MWAPRWIGQQWFTLRSLPQHAAIQQPPVTVTFSIDSRLLRAFAAAQGGDDLPVHYRLDPPDGPMRWRGEVKGVGFEAGKETGHIAVRVHEVKAD